MRLGVNIHADWGDYRNVRWLRENTLIRHIRADFPCKDTFENPVMMKQLDGLLDEVKDFETIMIHIGYTHGYDVVNFSKLGAYIKLVANKIEKKGLGEKAVIELWNNVNVDGCWKGDTCYKEFREMLIYISDAINFVKEKNIRTAGFSITLNHATSWRWLRELEPQLRALDFATIQAYPESDGQYIQLIERFEKEFPGMEYIVAETGHQGISDVQACKYAVLMREIEKATPKKIVFLYDLFNWDYVSQGKKWELINWTEEGPPYEKKTVKYLKESFTLDQLERDKPKSLYCCKQDTLWRKIVCLFKGIF